MDAGVWSWQMVVGTGLGCSQERTGQGVGRPREIAEQDRRHSRLTGSGPNVGGQGWVCVCVCASVPGVRGVWNIAQAWPEGQGW